MHTLHIVMLQREILSYWSNGSAPQREVTVQWSPGQYHHPLQSQHTPRLSCCTYIIYIYIRMFTRWIKRGWASILYISFSMAYCRFFNQFCLSFSDIFVVEYLAAISAAKKPCNVIYKLYPIPIYTVLHYCEIIIMHCCMWIRPCEQHFNTRSA